MLVVQVPLTLPKRYLLQQFNILLSKHHKGKRGVRTNKNSSARYKVSGHVDIRAIEKCLAVYDMREQTSLPFWDIAQQCKVSKPSQYLTATERAKKGFAAGKKRVLTTTAERLYKKALKIIAGTSEGKFPVLK
jgi:hypothetical protein